MREAIELYRKDGTATGVFYCSECRAVFGDEAQAQTCHGERICECGKKVEQRFYMKCRDCQDVEWREREKAKEAERFEKAEKVSYADYKGGMIYDGSRFFTDLEELEDQLEDFDSLLPEYVWACTDVGVAKATSESIVENLLENMWEDADHNDLNGLDELDAAIDKFNEANESISVWEPDYTTAILIEPITEAKEQIV